MAENSETKNLKAVFQTFFCGKTPDFFKRCIKNLTSLWASIIECAGDYIFYDNIWIILTSICFYFLSGKM